MNGLNRYLQHGRSAPSLEDHETPYVFDKSNFIRVLGFMTRPWKLGTDG